MNAQRPLTNQREKHPRRGDTAKVVLITLAVIFGSLLLLCAGAGIGGYFWLKSTFGQAFVNDPQVIRQMTTEVADIAIPPEFAPHSAMRFLGMTVINYRWCPEGNCPAASLEENVDEDAASEFGDDADSYGHLTFSSFPVNDNGEESVVEAEDADMIAEGYSEESLKTRFKDFTVEKQERTIKGRACTFYIVQGEEIIWLPTEEELDMDDSMETAAVETPASDATPADQASAPVVPEPVAADPTSEPTTTAEVAAPASEAAEIEPPSKPGRKVVEVQGVFPGKSGDVTLRYYATAEQYDPTKVLQLLDSIK